MPAWVFGVAPPRVLWANAVGAAQLGATDMIALAGRELPPTDALAAEIARLAVSLPRAGPPRLERLRGIGGGIGRRVVCACSRFSGADGMSGLLIAATEPVGPTLSAVDRVRRLFATLDAPLAVFDLSGALLYASAAAADCLGEAATLAAFGAEELGAQARRSGTARGSTPAGSIAVERLGTEGALLVRFENDASQSATEERSAEPAAKLSVVDQIVMPAFGPRNQTPDTASNGAPIKVPPRPLRFVWQMEADGRFTMGSEEFAAAMGARTLALLGQPWNDLARELGLDPEHRVEHAVASRDTWSGITVHWPVDSRPERVPVELSGLPIFDRDRQFRGYRGFGVCRDMARLAADAHPAVDTASSQAGPTVPSRGALSRQDAIEARRPQPAGSPAFPPSEGRPQLTLVPPAKNVVPFRALSPTPIEKRGLVSPVERPSIREVDKGPVASEPAGPGSPQLVPTLEEARSAQPSRALEPAPTAAAGRSLPQPLLVPSAFALPPASSAPTLDRLPLAVVVYRGHQLVYVNRTLLDWTGFLNLEAIETRQGLEGLFVEPNPARLPDGGHALAIASQAGETLAVEARLFTVAWEGAAASMLVLNRAASEEPLKEAKPSLCEAQTQARELRAILDTATDGVVVVERDGRIESLNRSAEALFGYEADQLTGRSFIDLFAPESHRAALEYLDGLALNGVASVLNDGREVIGRVRQGGLIPLFMTMGRIAEGTEKFCAVFRDITQWKRAEEDLLNAKRQAERASSAKSDFLAKISHEIRTPLNAIIGFSVVMMDERFGPIGTERYREYLRDIHASGGHLISLINDLLDLSKIEAGKLDLSFTSVNLNELVQQCVAMMQPQANQQRIIIRTSLSPTLPPVVVDARSIRQITLNLLSNSIKFTTAGGQVIVSTALTDRGEAVLRVRDTGIGMSEKEIETALEPFRQLATSARWGSGGTGLGLPLTKALAEANRATFTIKSAVNAGTLVEITFPATRVLAE
jgi:PAS domain S-box-containing protein